MKALAIAVAILTTSAALAANEPQDAELRRSPPPGRPVPQPPARNLAVVDREELNARMARLERLLEDVEDRLESLGEGRNKKLRRAQETLDSMQQLLAEAPSANGYQTPPPLPPPPPPPPVVRPMPDGPFQRLNEAVGRESFSEDKLSILTHAAANNHFLISQVAQLITHFSFSEDKLTLVRALKPRILDPENGYQLYSAFTFSGDKKRLQEILAQR